MKKLLFSLALFWGVTQAFSQNGVGIKAGLSSTSLDFKSKQFVPADAQTGYHVGLFGRFGGAGFFVQPEVLFTQTSGEFAFIPNGASGGTAPENYKAEFNRLDIPVMVGFRLLKVIRLMAGPIASVNIDSKLKDAGNTVQDVEFKKATLGYQAGLGVDLGNLSIEGKYEGGLSKVTENIGSFSTDNRINQWVLSVGFRIF
ncbi:outer membrane protein with beta-barrel domain [Algoriphagus boseongensis]|uniref:Outer membrane protein with beta-barrel domain n=1 Tax=Algoriphagus boseongensis TaxID=1442587 RepID=A0A4R6T2U3_9BACT|nr:porin family protein [Algoriphagus boseongensis]TDQ14983.1 outer membrane protein with beta-barrel domain [Algoriphagus boseongensis]